MCLVSPEFGIDGPYFNGILHHCHEKSTMSNGGGMKRDWRGLKRNLVLLAANDKRQAYTILCLSYSRRKCV